MSGLDGGYNGSSYSRRRLQALEDAWTAAGYRLRYERVHFPSAYCLLRQQKILIVSRFLSRKDRIDVLLALQNTLSGHSSN